MNNREIKFRVWDKLRRRFEPEGRYKNEYISIGLGFQSDVCISPNAFIVQQFTGGHDSKGVPVYEGDILYRPDVCIKYVCEYSLEEYAFILRFDKIDYCYLCDFKNLEVIGNILENPQTFD